MKFRTLLIPWNWFKNEAQGFPYRWKQTQAPSNDRPENRLPHEIDNLFDNHLPRTPLIGIPREKGNPLRNITSPKLDIMEDPMQYTVTLEVPGMNEKDMLLTLVDGTLMIRGEQRDEHHDTNQQYHLMERSYESFQRVLSLPTNVNHHTVVAKYTKGILRITMAKDPQAQPARRIIPLT